MKQVLIYSRTYKKEISKHNSNTDADNNRIEIINGTSYTDLKIMYTRLQRTSRSRYIL